MGLPVQKSNLRLISVRLLRFDATILFCIRPLRFGVGASPCACPLQSPFELSIKKGRHAGLPVQESNLRLIPARLLYFDAKMPSCIRPLRFGVGASPCACPLQSLFELSIKKGRHMGLPVQESNLRLISARLLYFDAKMPSCIRPLVLA